MTHSDEFKQALLLAERMTRAFAEATAAAVKRMHEAGVATVGVDAEGRIVRRDPDGTETVIGHVQQGPAD